VISTNCPPLSSRTPSRGIWFGNYCFSEPELLPCSLPAHDSGLFAILVHDPTCQPRSLRVLYFGESENIPSDLTPWHQKYQSWCSIAAGAINLYVAFFGIASSAPEERRAAVSDLISLYQPECN
jgi:hypothetical protein